MSRLIVAWLICGAIGTSIAYYKTFFDSYFRHRSTLYKWLLVDTLCMLGGPLWLVFVGLPALAEWLEE